MAEKVLIVEDDGAQGTLLTGQLRAFGYEPVWATSAGDALRLAEEIHPDLALMDVVLGEGDLDGIAVADQLRTRFGIPSVYLTGVPEATLLARAAGTEPYGILVKPYEPRNLRASLDLALARVKIDAKRIQTPSRYQTIFDDSPISLWEGDLSAVKSRLASLQDSGVPDLRSFLSDHPEELAALLNLVRVVEVNHATLAMFRITARKDLPLNLSRFFTDNTFAVFRELIACLFEGADEFESEILARRFDGEVFDAYLQLSVATGHEKHLTKVIATISDVSHKKRVERVALARSRIIEFSLGHSLTEVMTFFLDEAERLTGSTVGFFRLVENDGQTIGGFGFSTRTLERFCRRQPVEMGQPDAVGAVADGPPPSHPFPPSRGSGPAEAHQLIDRAGAWADCVREGRPSIVNDFAALPHRNGFPPGHPEIRRFVTVPVFRGGSVVAILGLANKTGAYDDWDAWVLGHLADQVWEVIDRKRGEETLRESQQLFRSVFDNSPLFMGVFELQGDQVRLIDGNPALAACLGVPRASLPGRVFQEAQFPPGLFTAWIQKFRESEACRGSVLIEGDFPAASEMRWVRSQITFFDRSPGGAPRFSFVTEDVTGSKRSQERLEEALREREILIREVHHRVKNQLMVVKSLIALQASRTTDSRTLALFQDLQTRLLAMGMVHEDLYRSDNLVEVEFSGYLERLVNNIRRALAKNEVAVKVVAANLPLKADRAIPCGLIVAELVTNACKHAFPPSFGKRAPEIRVELKRDGEGYRLLVGDNGCGFPEGVDLASPTTLGLELVRAWAVQQLKGTIEVDHRKGTRILIRFQDRPRARESLLPPAN